MTDIVNSVSEITNVSEVSENTNVSESKEAEKEINIVHLYPDLLNLYGDKGNIACMQKRLQWRGIKANILNCTNSDHSINLEDADIIFVGGGSDREQEIVCNLLLKKKQEITNYVENGGTLVAVCGGYQLLGKYYQTATSKIEGLGILDIYTDSAETRLIGNVVLEADFISQKIVGFENHAGRTYIGDHTPLGKVVYGHGNTGESGYEGVVYKNVIATYLHGPLFPKNPQLCDYILANAVKRKYPDFGGFEPLNDELEDIANKYIEDRFVAENKKK